MQLSYFITSDVQYVSIFMSKFSIQKRSSHLEKLKDDQRIKATTGIKHPKIQRRRKNPGIDDTCNHRSHQIRKIANIPVIT